jgi:predicted transcriptional regulator
MAIILSVLFAIEARDITVNHEAVLAVLTDSKEEALSMREIAQTLGLDISTYTNRIRTRRSLARVLRALIKWGWVESDKRQRSEGSKFWFKAYWKTELAWQNLNSQSTSSGPLSFHSGPR